jgi:ribosomal protein S18 acetylase RimI-like enzyme
MSLYLRPAMPQDELFLYQLAYETFYEQLHAELWDPNIRESVLKMQIDGQRGSYAAQFPNADHGIIMLDDRPVGRLIVDRGPEVHHLVDITILKRHRSAGIGTVLIRALGTEGDLMRKPIRLHVMVTNRAKALYQRMGFRLIEENPVTWLMERPPGSGLVTAVSR